MKLADALSGEAGALGLRRFLREPPQRRILRRELEALLAHGQALGPCRLRRAKFKPGRKLTAYYDVVIASPEGDRSLRPIAVTWECHGTENDVQPGFTELQEKASRAQLTARFKKFRASVPEFGLSILVWPLDPRYPQLVQVSDPRHVRAMLAEADPAAGRATRERYRVSAVRYRPGQRHVLRYDSTRPRNEEDRGPAAVFAKLYQNGDSDRAFRSAMALSDWLETSRSPVTAAAPFRYIAAADVVLYAEVPGAPLSLSIARGRRDLGDQFRRAGAALRVLHSAPAEFAQIVPRQRFESEIQTIARTSQHIQALLPEVGSRIRAILDRAVELEQQLPKEPATFAHGDYKADHLFAHGDRLTLIDFDSCTMAEPALDLGKFLSDLDWWYAVTRKTGVGRAKRTFLDGYGLPARGNRMDRARLWEALALTKIAAHRVPVFSPTWARDSARLIGVADTLIERLWSEVMRGHLASSRDDRLESMSLS